jgi:hypothetical protein
MLSTRKHKSNVKNMPYLKIFLGDSVCPKCVVSKIMASAPLVIENFIDIFEEGTQG